MEQAPMKSRKPKAKVNADEIFVAQLRSMSLNEDDLQEILRRMCRSLSDVQGNHLGDFLFIIDPKDRAKVHRRFVKLLGEELFNQHDYQHEHQGRQGPPTGRFAVKLSDHTC
jgi:hypothetical protein